MDRLTRFAMYACTAMAAIWVVFGIVGGSPLCYPMAAVWAGMAYANYWCQS